MNFPFYIARRYLLSKKSHNAINWISGISMLGVAIATMALVVTLSVFNGFHDMVESFFTTLDPQLRIVPQNGKAILADDPLLAKVSSVKGVAVVSERIEDQALLMYKERQQVVNVRGVDDKFQQLTQIDSILYGDGEFKLWTDVMDMEAANRGELKYDRKPCATLGLGIAEELGTGLMFDAPLQIFAPQREGQIDVTDAANAFEVENLYSNGVVFCVKQAKYDKNLIIVPIALARRLFHRQGMITSLDVKVDTKQASVEKVKKQIESIVGAKFKVLSQYEQQEDVFRIMKIEKLIAYIFLTFILMVACFNIIGSLSMLIVEKQDDVETLRSLGANDKAISKIFLFEGRLISTIGAIIGIVVGLFLCYLQQTYGLIALGKSSGSFVIDYYPVNVHPSDIVIIFITVIVVGWLSVWYPVRNQRQNRT